MRRSLLGACEATLSLRAARSKLQLRSPRLLAPTASLHVLNQSTHSSNISKKLPTVHGSTAAVQTRRYASSSQENKKTPLYDLHVRHGGKMVAFAGYQMPVQYADLGVRESHAWTREKASIFDVSHMVQHHFSGPGAEGLLEKITPASLATLQPHHSGLSTLLYPETGGIVDDGIITRIGPEFFYVVTNAGCREKDLAFLQQSIDEWHASGGQKAEWKVLDGWGLIALQGPLSAEILESLLANPEEAKLKETFFGQSKFVQLQLPREESTVPLLVSRGGYTGEDGFEISVPADATVAVVERLLDYAGSDRIRLAGLGARDSLRLEAGMCLYGHDLKDHITPVEASLSWVIGKDRRQEGGFNGSDVILRQLKPKKEGGGVEQRRIGLIVEGAPAREGAAIVTPDGEKIGDVTSGCPSPTLGKNIAMGYIKSGFNKAGTEVGVVVRGKQRPATVAKMPFVPSKYWKGGLTPG